MGSVREAEWPGVGEINVRRGIGRKEDGKVDLHQVGRHTETLREK